MDEPQVAAVIANDIAERKTGTIAVSVLRGLRLTLAAALEKHGPEAFDHGLEVAIAAGKPVRYAIGVMRKHRPEEAQAYPYKPGDPKYDQNLDPDFDPDVGVEYDRDADSKRSPKEMAIVTALRAQWQTPV